MSSSTSITIDKLRGRDNVNVWLPMVEAAITIKGARKALTRADSERASDVEEATAFTTVLGAMDNNVAQQVAHLKTAKEILKKVRADYTSENVARIAQLRSDLLRIKQGPRESVKDYTARINKIVADLTSARERPSDFDQADCFLRGLASDYDMVVTAVRVSMKKDDMKIDAIMPQILSREAGLATDHSSGASTAFYTQRRGRGRGRSSGGRGQNSNNREPLRCFKCGSQIT